MFEEEYRRAAKLPEFSSLFKEVDLTSEAEDVHDGYFSIDKNKRWTDTADNNQANRDSAERAYNLIMRSEEHTSELQSLMRNSYAVFCLKKKKKSTTTSQQDTTPSTITTKYIYFTQLYIINTHTAPYSFTN